MVSNEPQGFPNPENDKGGEFVTYHNSEPANKDTKAEETIIKNTTLSNYLVFYTYTA